MSVSKKVLAYLDGKKVKYEVVPHRKVFTAYDLAQTLGEELNKIAKTLLVKVELPELKKSGKYYVVAVPASYRVDPAKIKKQLKAARVELAPERVFKQLGIEPGALSPFAGMHQLELLLDKTLLRTKKAIVRAGSLTESLRVAVKDLHKMEKAKVGVFGGKVAGLKLQVKVQKAKRKRGSGKGKKKGRKGKR
ncbi:hypothetical protein A3F28_04195 [Candidatus Uhrbacteria bacterium RIFCSPHIGHO2_12_FULL_57_11]|uniref:YbaK/aminoacyl-tRNA synthetase-associated domain-containing protein n=2 Tax=Candidatus Uhriibacteriota TaxID=1752732 RepID=A0A1F7UJV6_9BACT|nr:MAG: hypothetical protein A3D72_03610 [Candidatus Uhrbacteria bacterium RIFCSPHIGHO2_02_FULL_57_19]OGL78560.1 MAG: hypothetical protein A3F28_04195 [Candidatus Uhrbacteria bacterium RIFCSPHIGHO2_12_FULL_57_11]